MLLCLLALADCDDSGCDRVFYAEQGSVEITALGETFAASVQDAVFDEVEINDTTYVSTPISGGDTWCLDDYEFNEELPICASVGDVVSDFSLQSCGTGEMVSMSSLAEGQQALLLLLTAG